ncbi:MAG: indole-3-glycerol phosphate synthase TrpC [Anaerolineales bacterium]
MTRDGVIHTDTILDKIIAHKHDELALAIRAHPLDDIRASAENSPSPPDFLSALTTGEHVALIAEVKKASPSKGVLAPDFDPVALATDYAAQGASAISVLTDERFFGGGLAHLRAVRAAVEVPLLRKEFIISPYQVYEARAAGASAALLIVAALEDTLLQTLYDAIREQAMTPLIEVHNEAELQRALRLNPAPRLIGVNNRNLHTFEVDLGTTSRLAARMPPNTLVVGESGITTADDVRALGPVHAILVGETLVKAVPRGVKIQELAHVRREIQP